MIYHKYIKYLLILAGTFVFAACEAPPAYVHVAEEFNREADFFLKGVTSRDLVNVCYHKNGTTPQQVAALAISECTKFSKRAIFMELNLQTCPLVTPISAIYKCE
jgi:hypothetical protein